MFDIKSPFVEGLKQLLRVALVAVIPLVISGLQTNSIDWRSIVIAGIIAVLMGLDKFLHKSEVGVAGNGLTGI
jgi:hypothetical protein